MHFHFWLLPFLSLSISFAQPRIEEDLKIPYQNAIKGIYWALENIPVKKMNLENDLISDNKIYANVRLSKEINGVKIKSTGYADSYEVSILMYRTYESLEKEGFINPPLPEENKEDEVND
jgi:hypothetical protein